jgi:hypothetical protein
MTRYATALLLLPDDSYLTAQIIELNNGFVTKIYPFTEELHSTIWIEGAIQVIDVTEDRREAYRLSPFDMINKKIVDGTLRTRLL